MKNVNIKSPSTDTSHLFAEIRKQCNKCTARDNNIREDLERVEDTGVILGEIVLQTQGMPPAWGWPYKTTPFHNLKHTPVLRMSQLAVRPPLIWLPDPVTLHYITVCSPLSQAVFLLRQLLQIMKIDHSNKRKSVAISRLVAF